MNARFSYATLLAVVSIAIAICTANAQQVVAPTASPQNSVFKVGVLLSLTGSNSELALEVRNGIELMLSENTPIGGADSNLLPRVIYEDIGATSPTASAAASSQESETARRLNDIFKRLVLTEHVQAIISDVNPDTSVPLILPATTYRIPYILLSVSDSTFAADNQYAFTLVPKLQSLDKGYRQYFDRFKDIKKIALFCSNSEKGLVYRSIVKEIAQAYGVTVVEELCGNESAYDFRVNIMRASSASPDGVFIGLQPDLTKRWMDSLNFHPKILATEEVANALRFNSISEKDAEGISFVDWPVGDVFIKAYQAKYGTVPVYMSYLGYEAMNVVIKAHGKSQDDLRKGIKMLKYSGAGGEINFLNEQGGNMAQSVLKRVVHGRVETVN